MGDFNDDPRDFIKNTLNTSGKNKLLENQLFNPFEILHQSVAHQSTEIEYVRSINNESLVNNKSLKYIKAVFIIKTSYYSDGNYKGYPCRASIKFISWRI